MKSLLYEIIATAASIDALATKTLKPYKLTPMTFNILNLLKEGPLSQREIGDQVIVAASSITFQVRQLQKKGLIQRRRSDARTWQVSLTDIGLDRLGLAERSMDEVISMFKLDEDQASKAKSALISVKNQVNQVYDSP